MFQHWWDAHVFEFVVQGVFLTFLFGVAVVLYLISEWWRR